MQVLRDMFGAAVASASPSLCLPPHLPSPPKGRTIVVGAGKASAEMARVLEDHYPAPVEGLVVTRYGHGAPTRSIEVAEAGHPVPDAAGEAAARRILALVADLTADDLVIVLLSGGGSALLPVPAPGLTLADKQGVTSALLRSGATITEINCVRRHLSGIKGGRLAAAARPARLVTLAISDVPGDDPLVIASGPTVPDPTSFADALMVLDRYRVSVGPLVRACLERGADRVLRTRGAYVLIARPADVLRAAAGVAADAGYRPVILGDAIEGEAREVAKIHGALALDFLARRERVALISGGELTVTMQGVGIGGPNHEYALALMLACGGTPGLGGMACDTDGIDGVTNAAGAWFDGQTLASARGLGLDPADVLRRNDVGAFFAALDRQLVTGPTRTNVNDFRAVLIDP
ncbi:glycerate kinase [Iodidimonas sp. SYSU 1G8]|uniref:glycerate kinase type-2 family protein n=1 Tax=Iodidimonas sp. SYSU 1G8 TaxID=3133967 RepID=UPI0031FEA197